MIKQTPRILPCAGFALVCALGGPQAHATLIDDFESVDASGGPVSPSGTIWDGDVFAGTGNTLEVIEDSANLLGAGTSNQIAHLADVSTSQRVTLYANNALGTADDVVTLSFDFYEPSGVNGGDLFIRLRDNGTRLVDARFDDGTAADNGGNVTGAYSQDAALTFYIVANNSGSTVSYGGTDVANDTYDIWVDSGSGASVIVNDAPFRDSGGSFFNDLEIGMFTSQASQEVYLDNLNVTAGVVIPEPASLVFMGLGGLLMLSRSRRAA